MNITSPIQPTSVPIPAPKISAQDKARLREILDELARLDGKRAEINNLRKLAKSAAAAYADGELSLMQAAGLAAIPPGTIPAARLALRNGIRRLQGELIEANADLIHSHRAHVVDSLAEKCKAMESGERRNAAAVGISEDEFAPSALLESLRQQHLNALRDLDSRIVTRAGINDLAEALAIEIPTPVPADDALDDADDVDGDD